MHTQPQWKGFTCVLSNVIQQKGVLRQSLHLCGNDILQLQPATQWIALSILDLNSTITTFVIFIKTIITWTCNIYSSHKRLLLHFPVIKYKIRNARIHHSDNTSPLHLQLRIGKAHHKSHGFLPSPLPRGLVPSPINLSHCHTGKTSVQVFTLPQNYSTFLNIISILVLPDFFPACGNEDNVLSSKCHLYWRPLPGR